MLGARRSRSVHCRPNYFTNECTDRFTSIFYLIPCVTLDKMSGNDPKPVKLPYFHRTLSPQDAALIGDTTPKPISPATASPVEAGRTVHEASAWNAAQTWEERDCSAWGKGRIREIFDGSSTDGSVTFSEPSKVEGHANITHVRGRARFMYEWDFSVSASVDHNGSIVSLSVDVGEAINDQLDDIVLTPSWKTAGLTRDVQKAVLAKLQSAIVQKMRDFEAQFREYRP